MRFSNSVMTLLMLTIFVVLVVTATGYPANARFMPLVVGIPAIGLCLLQLVLDARERRSATHAATEQNAARASAKSIPPAVLDTLPAIEREPELNPREVVRREMVLWAYFLGLLGGILLFGFWATIPVFLVSFLRFHAKAGWGRALLMTGIAWAILYGGIDQAFRIDVHRGFVTEYLEAWAGTEG